MAGRGDINAGGAFVRLFLKNDLTKGLNAASARLKAFGSSISAVGSYFTNLGKQIVQPLADAVLHFADVGSQLNDLSVRTGVAAGTLAELKFAAEQSGSSLDEVANAINKAQKGGFGSNFGKLAEDIAAIEDPNKRTAKAMEVFGKSGAKLLPMIMNLKELRAEAQRRGLVPSEESVQAADRIGDALDTIKSIAGGVAYEVGSALAPMLEPWLETVSNVLTWTVRWVRENGKLFRAIAIVGGAIMVAGMALTIFGGAVFALGAILGGAATILSFLSGALALLLNPIVLIGAALAIGVYAWAKWTASGQAAVRNLVAFFQPLLETVRSTFQGIVDAVMAGDLELAGKIALTGLQLVFAQGLQAIADLIGGTLGGALSLIGSQMLGGEFAGAWNTAVMGMAAIWDGFVSGVVNTFTEAAKKVTAVWQETVSKISDFILDTSAQGGVFGAAMSKVLGVDMQAEQARSDKLNSQLGLAPQNVTDEAKAVAREQISGTRAAMDSALDEYNRAIAARATQSGGAFGGEVAGGGAALGSDIASLTEELAILRGQASSERAAAAGKIFDPTTFPEEELASKAKSLVTFSGAALAGQAGGGVQERMAKTLVELLNESKLLRSETTKSIEETRKLLTA